ncbi:bifunctional diaminohydroxyphosphoribosylaminopyrimidine deaminase/5-amino-6-(5-phosphoribosylamino)uracil reductase RibD [Glaciecola sp. SC05]|uniref:bifunctional diaminohydroxyphosphoribosylaminopyrimidine deaminase/5-amino-6-(5-phosphoribosylamino)uracil reductase RibD n=1 Tax=Glaciecola sp. SC05 TaxID=1987355 RepID=UPI003528569F
MARALRLAEQGNYSVTPNPSVGCVIVSATGKVVGEGFHYKSGTAHAEVHALEQAGLLAKSATAYVTLEPCSHYGRTPPCALALINAGIQKVVIAVLDSNPEVAGKGVKLLEDAGIVVKVGLMQQQAEQLNIGFFTRMRTGRPYIRLKLAASLDGKTALQNGKSQWITSDDARRDVQLERAKSCAILTGSGTALADNPRLNVRSNELPDSVAKAFLQREAQPLRVVIDGKNRLHDELILCSDGSLTRIYNCMGNNKLGSTSVSQVQLPLPENERHVDLSRMLDDLGAQGLNNIWVEAGAKLAGAMLEANLVDELILYLAPKFLGGGARELLSTLPKQDLQEAINTRVSSITQVGPDIKIICQMR